MEAAAWPWLYPVTELRDSATVRRPHQRSQRTHFANNPPRTNIRNGLQFIAIIHNQLIEHAPPTRAKVQLSSTPTNGKHALSKDNSCRSHKTNRTSLFTPAQAVSAVCTAGKTNAKTTTGTSSRDIEMPERQLPRSPGRMDVQE